MLVKIEKEVNRPRVFDRNVIFFDLGYGKVVNFGNSGLVLAIERDSYGCKKKLFHFLPEKRMEPHEVRAKAAKMLGSGLYGVWEWLNFPPSSQVEVVKELDCVSATTNKTLARAIERLFKQSGHGELVRIESYGFDLLGVSRIEINLVGFGHLEQDDPLIKRLKMFDRLARELIVTN